MACSFLFFFIYSHFWTSVNVSSVFNATIALFKLLLVQMSADSSALTKEQLFNPLWLQGLYSKSIYFERVHSTFAPIMPICPLHCFIVPHNCHKIVLSQSDCTATLHARHILNCRHFHIINILKSTWRHNYQSKRPFGTSASKDLLAPSGIIVSWNIRNLTKHWTGTIY